MSCWLRHLNCLVPLFGRNQIFAQHDISGSSLWNKPDMSYWLRQLDCLVLPFGRNQIFFQYNISGSSLREKPFTDNILAQILLLTISLTPTLNPNPKP